MKHKYSVFYFLGIVISLQLAGFKFSFAQAIPKAEMLETVDQSLTGSVKQYKLLIRNLQPDEWPRTFKDGKLLTVTPRAWISGFYPGTLLYLYEFSQDDSSWNEAAERLKLMEGLKTMEASY